ncbi:MAG TPA: 3-oxoacyl-ACP reductase family protein [Burkholderiales bacterium]|jgi:3-oxoacyl-[acyl-carrier protein] reductase|nr:3-oxoacyl-ACP reductase family protein [Burkholderiales bacterium]
MTAQSLSAIVTGGSRGIGRAIAEALAKAGFRVAVGYRERRAEAEALATRIHAAGGEAIAVRTDVTRTEDAAALVKATLAAFGGVDVLVNNAGIALPNVNIADTDAQQWERVLAVNLTAPFHLIRAVLPHMREQRRGHIINISSNATRRLPAGLGAYAVSKAGLEALTHVLAKEEGPNGIRVNAVAPGPVRTEMLEEYFTKMGPERTQAFLGSIPLRRAGEPHEIAAMVAFLATDAAYVTGQVIFVNGGGPGG